jgi:hypothetical protein
LVIVLRCLNALIGLDITKPGYDETPSFYRVDIAVLRRPKNVYANNIGDTFEDVFNTALDAIV